ncbi:MAG: hypothetical protein J6A21_10005 [Lentisphaeria bacterium]|nr:hypothetical protein [Lentisphaeria bacterium]
MKREIRISRHNSVILSVFGTIVLLASAAVCGAEQAEAPLFLNGDFNKPWKLNEVQIKLWEKRGNVCVNNTAAVAWTLNTKNSKLELCAHPDREKDFYVKLSSGILYQLFYGRAKCYKVSFRAKGPGTLKLLFYRYHADAKRKINYFGTKVGANKIQLGEDWKEYSFTYKKEFDDEVFAPAFAQVAGEVCFDDVTFTEVPDEKK